MPLLYITPSQVNVQLGRTLGGMSQDLLEDGGGATRLYPECSSGVAEEVGGDLHTCSLSDSPEDMLNGPWPKGDSILPTD